LLEFSRDEKLINNNQYVEVAKLADELGAMIWGVINNKKVNL